MTSPSPQLRRAVAAFDHLDRRTALHVAARARSAPLDAVVDLLPAGGALLDAGCGHGLVSILAALRDPEREVIGVDIDAAKLDAARAAADRLGLAGRVRFRQVEPGWRPSEPIAAIVVVDVLYLLGGTAAAGWLGSLGAAVDAGGRLVVKELDDHPRWRLRLALAQERVAVRLARITEGAAIDPLPPARIESILTSAGLRTRRAPLGAGWLHPHAAIVGDRPG